MLKHREYFQSEDSNLPRNMSPHVKIREICSDKSIRWHQGFGKSKHRNTYGLEESSAQKNKSYKHAPLRQCPLRLKPLINRSVLYRFAAAALNGSALLVPRCTLVIQQQRPLLLCTFFLWGEKESQLDLRNGISSRRFILLVLLVHSF